jgi:beta-lactamase class A
MAGINRFIFFSVAAPIVLLMNSCSSSQKMKKRIKQGPDSLVQHILDQYPEQFDTLLRNDDRRIQIIYTQIDRNKNNRPKFTDYYYHVDKANYFYPASTVKLPVAALALQKLSELHKKGLDENSTMITEQSSEGQTAVYNDPTTRDGRPTVAHYIKKIFLVSDNDAFNRLYEFLGQEYINNSLHEMGYEDVQIVHRLNISLTEKQNRLTNPVRFFDTSSNLIYEQPEFNSKLVTENRTIKMGKGFISDGQLVNEPFDFASKNRLNLKDLHEILRSILFPKALPRKKRFGLRSNDYALLHRYMGMYPSESNYPGYDSSTTTDTHVKFLFYGAEPVVPMAHIRIFNKIGDAYGFLTDAAYVVDFKNNIEFMVTATIHCNSDGIYNDDHYEYDSVGYPFLKNLGRAVYDYEIKRVRKNVPDLSSFKFDWKGSGY